MNFRHPSALILTSLLAVSAQAESPNGPNPCADLEHRIQKKSEASVNRALYCELESGDALTAAEYKESFATLIDRTRSGEAADIIASIPTYPMKSASFCLAAIEERKAPIFKFWSKDKTRVVSRWMSEGYVEPASIENTLGLAQNPFGKLDFAIGTKSDSSLSSSPFEKSADSGFDIADAQGGGDFMAYQELSSRMIFKNPAVAKVVRIRTFPSNDPNSVRAAVEMSYVFSVGLFQIDTKSISFTSKVHCRAVQLDPVGPKGTKPKSNTPNQSPNQAPNQNPIPVTPNEPAPVVPVTPPNAPDVPVTPPNEPNLPVAPNEPVTPPNVPVTPPNEPNLPVAPPNAPNVPVTPPNAPNLPNTPPPVKKKKPIYKKPAPSKPTKPSTPAPKPPVKKDPPKTQPKKPVKKWTPPSKPSKPAKPKPPVENQPPVTNEPAPIINNPPVLKDSIPSNQPAPIKRDSVNVPAPVPAPITNVPNQVPNQAPNQSPNQNPKANRPPPVNVPAPVPAPEAPTPTESRPQVPVTNENNVRPITNEPNQAPNQAPNQSPNQNPKQPKGHGTEPSKKKNPFRKLFPREKSKTQN